MITAHFFTQHHAPLSVGRLLFLCLYLFSMESSRSYKGAASMAVLLKLCTVFMFWILQHLIYKDFSSVALKGEAV